MKSKIWKGEYVRSDKVDLFWTLLLVAVIWVVVGSLIMAAPSLDEILKNY